MRIRSSLAQGLHLEILHPSAHRELLGVCDESPADAAAVVGGADRHDVDLRCVGPVVHEGEKAHVLAAV